MERCKTLMLATVMLLALAACDNKTASSGRMQTASIAWDEIASADRVAHAPTNANLIFMR